VKKEAAKLKSKKEAAKPEHKKAPKIEAKKEKIPHGAPHNKVDVLLHLSTTIIE